MRENGARARPPTRQEIRRLPGRSTTAQVVGCLPCASMGYRRAAGGDPWWVIDCGSATTHAGALRAWADGPGRTPWTNAEDLGVDTRHAGPSAGDIACILARILHEWCAQGRSDGAGWCLEAACEGRLGERRLASAA
jgi:hypothetical protein